MQKLFCATFCGQIRQVQWIILFGMRVVKNACDICLPMHTVNQWIALPYRHYSKLLLYHRKGSRLSPFEQEKWKTIHMPRNNSYVNPHFNFKHHWVLQRSITFTRLARIICSCVTCVIYTMLLLVELVLLILPLSIWNNWQFRIFMYGNLGTRYKIMY